MFMVETFSGFIITLVFTFCFLGAAAAATITIAIGSPWLLALVFPVRRAIATFGMLAPMLTAPIAYAIRNRAWLLIRRIALGLDGYPHRLPNVSSVPADLGYVYEELPESVILRTLSKRNDLVSKSLNSATDILSALILTSSDIEALLEILQDDLSLVHASYYQDRECIERIAAWIAGQEAQRLDVAP